MHKYRVFHLFFVILVMLQGCSYVQPSQHKSIEYTTVVASVSNCELTVVQEAVETNRAVLEKTEWEGATLLHNAVKNNCKDVTEYLLNEGADVNAKMDDGVTPLHISARNGNIEISEILIMHGANINAVDSQGWTPLDRAVIWKKEDAVTFLKSHGGRSSKQENQEQKKLF